MSNPAQVVAAFIGAIEALTRTRKNRCASDQRRVRWQRRIAAVERARALRALLFLCFFAACSQYNAGRDSDKKSIHLVPPAVIRIIGGSLYYFVGRSRRSKSPRRSRCAAPTI